MRESAEMQRENQPVSKPHRFQLRDSRCQEPLKSKSPRRASRVYTKLASSIHIPSKADREEKRLTRHAHAAHTAPSPRDTYQIDSHRPPQP